jgi:RNA polymerase sigma-70 factor (ECF subfamily)
VVLHLPTNIDDKRGIFLKKIAAAAPMHYNPDVSINCAEGSAMWDESSFNQLMTRLREGSQGAAAHLFDKYVDRLIALAKSRLSGRLRTHVDPEDVVQSAFRSFFIRQRDGRVVPTNWESLWSLLAVITIRKCIRRAEYAHAGIRDVRREQAQAAATESSCEMEVIAQEPKPEDAAILVEVVERIMSELEPRERLILSERLQGATTDEIARSVSRSKRTVERVLERVRLQLEQWSNET